METNEFNLEYLPRFPKNREMTIGCIGSGFIMADCHLVAYRNAGFNPTAIASATPARSGAVAERHNIPKVYDNYNELLKDESLAIIDIAVPPDKTIEVIREAVKHADHIKGILAQKPFGKNYAEAKKMEQLCADAGIKLAVNQNMRYDQSIRTMKSILTALCSLNDS